MSAIKYSKAKLVLRLNFKKGTYWFWQELYYARGDANDERATSQQKLKPLNSWTKQQTSTNLSSMNSKVLLKLFRRKRSSTRSLTKRSWKYINSKKTVRTSKFCFSVGVGVKRCQIWDRNWRGGQWHAGEEDDQIDLLCQHDDCKRQLGLRW